jgi:hypothetical protein
MAHRLGKLLIWKTKKDNTVFLIDSIIYGSNRVDKVNATPIASYKEDRRFNIKAKPFLQPASMISQSKVNDFYIRNAEKRFQKMKK